MSLGPTGAACLLGLVGPGGACLGLASRPPQVLTRDRYGACLGKLTEPIACVVFCIYVLFYGRRGRSG